MTDGSYYNVKGYVDQAAGLVDLTIYNASGTALKLADGTTTARSAPVQVGSASNWVGVTIGDFHTLALQADNSVWAWGFNLYGQLGDGTTPNRATPGRVPGVAGLPTRALSAGNLHVLGRPGWVMAFLFTACAALRLARFNVNTMEIMPVAQSFAPFQVARHTDAD